MLSNIYTVTITIKCDKSSSSPRISPVHPQKKWTMSLHF